MPCFSDLLCTVSYSIMNDMDVTMENTTDDDDGSMMTYSYPNHILLLSDLNSGETYNYKVTAVSATNLAPVGEPMYGSFTTRSENHDGM